MGGEGVINESSNIIKCMSYDSPLTEMRVSSEAKVRLGVTARKRALDSAKALGAEKMASANAKATTTEAVNRRHLYPMTSTP